MKATIYYKSLKDGNTFPILNTREIKFNSLTGLKRAFNRVIDKDRTNLRLFYGVTNIVQASAYIEGKAVPCAITDVKF